MTQPVQALELDSEVFEDGLRARRRAASSEKLHS